MTDAPLWLQDPGLQTFLKELVSRLDRAEGQGKPLARAVPVDARTFPAFFKADLENTREQYWTQLLQLAVQGWFHLETDRVPQGAAAYECRPRVSRLDTALLRHATGQVGRQVSPAEQWRAAVLDGLKASPEVLVQVCRYRLEVPGRSPAELVAQLAQLPSLTNADLMLREVSAKLFWGQSKVLDGRQALVAALLGVPECPFPEMPVQLHVRLPRCPAKEVLFIENLTTFEQVSRNADGALPEVALIYAAGFKASARRLRRPEGVSLYLAATGDLSPDGLAAFQDWLFGQHELSCWFWGDLDDAGMDILARLREGFPDMKAWTPGYAPMVRSLLAGEGHTPEHAQKAQTRATLTGCPYADTVLIPALRQTDRYLDQEYHQVLEGAL